MDKFNIDIVSSYHGLIQSVDVNREGFLFELNKVGLMDDESFDTYKVFYLNGQQVHHEQLVKSGDVVIAILGEEKHFASRRDAIEYGRTMGFAAYSLIVDKSGRVHARFKKLSARSELGRQLGL